MRSNSGSKTKVARALGQAAQLLGTSDDARLRAALICAGVDEIAKNAAFRERVREHYEAASSSRRSRTSSKWVQLTPINPGNRETLDLFGPVDPYWIQKVYGASQLPIALNMFPLATLKEASAMVERGHPGTKPKNRGRIDDIITYIVQQVTKDGPPVR